MISPTILSPWGIFEDGGEIYIMDGGLTTNNVYRIDKNDPYTLTQVGSTGYLPYGASQQPSCLTVNFTPPL